MAAVLRKLSRRNILLFLSILGPGIITANVDNDAGGITTYSLAGARYGYGLLWMMLPTMAALVVVQEMCARMGAVTGKGLSDLIRERFGVGVTFYVMIALYLTNLGNTVSEFAGIAASLEIFGVSRFISVPLSAAAVWLLIVKGSYRIVEKVFLFACLIYLAYPLAAILAKPDWMEVARAAVVPDIRWDGGYVTMMIAMVGTTIAPWMQFYQQATVVEKGITREQYAFARLDVIVGCFLAIVVAFFIVASCAAAIHQQGLTVETAADAAQALAPAAGPYATLLFAVGLFNASLFAACVLPLSTAYYICEGMGWELGVDKSFREAPQFFGLFTLSIVLSALVIMVPDAPLLAIMYLSQVVNGAVLPAVLVLMLLIVNDRRIMGAFVNGPAFNAVSWFTVGVVTLLTLILTADAVWPGFMELILPKG
ncbi:Divalent metal cation transporter MntH [Fundidesulfovibrio magnetotacticus]|uniref:Divalent metal cation transporter MntH n=1 Tax=Fundidesulfovibrio magnetotacticus TaxID=2730080 RepID=A0A6V8LRA4_9BACT|nr:Nramp family divalent metal transporter [Fundidesulfovibrio magnetotacticus]GFK92659.1 Divalent metal cation transporter MntH [Fundidesulfovibrio magnetotacticus]